MAKGQQQLIEVAPKNSKKIIDAAAKYQEWQNKRTAALAKEKEYKQKILELVRAAKLQPLEDGTTRFELDGIKITITPQNELVQIKSTLTPVE